MLLDLDGRIDAVVVSGRADVGVESTVVTLCTDPPRLLRPGGITLEQLKKVLPDIVVDKAVLSAPEEGKPVASPGMKYKHYSPKAKVVILDGDLDSFVNYVESRKCEGEFALCFEGEEKRLTIPTVSFGKWTVTSHRQRCSLMRCVSLTKRAAGFAMQGCRERAE